MRMISVAEHGYRRAPMIRRIGGLSTFSREHLSCSGKMAFSSATQLSKLEMDNVCT